MALGQISDSCRSGAFVSLFVGTMCVLGLSLGAGCGSDSDETVVITLVPWSLDFSPSNQLFLVERQSRSVWKFTGEEPSGQLLPPLDGDFTPWGIDVGDENLLFVSDESAARPRRPRLLALRADFDEAVPVGPDTLLAEASETSPGSPIPSPRAVESLPLGGNLYLVFLAAGSKVIVFTYDGNAPSLVYARTIDGGCGDVFEQPFGLAVDPGNRILYVVDGGGKDRLYRFSAIDRASPVCDASVDRWGELSLDDPGGVAAKGGQPTSKDNRIVVADTDNSRIVAFYWDGQNLAETDLPADFSPPPGKKPFDVAFDAEGKLWASYPF